MAPAVKKVKDVKCIRCLPCAPDYSIETEQLLTVRFFGHGGASAKFIGSNFNYLTLLYVITCVEVSGD